MAFYTDRWIIVEKGENDIQLFRKKDKAITREKIVGEVKEDNRECLCEDAFKEYDLEVDLKGDIYLLYQNDEMNLILKILKENKTETIKLTNQPIAEVIHLNINIINDNINILYIIATREKNNYEIYHHFYRAGKWNTSMIDEIIGEKVLNPIKVLKQENGLVLSYIKDKEIYLKEFSLKGLKWKKAVKITDSENGKLFLDVIATGDIFHISFCEFIHESLVVKYKRLILKDESFKSIREDTLSKKGSPSYPTLISYKDEIWLAWIEFDKVNSRVLKKSEKDWSSVYLWNESISKDIIRYKYIEKAKSDDVILDYSFGKAYPEVQFLGFGPTNKAKKVKD